MPEEQQPEGALVVDTERDRLGYVMVASDGSCSFGR